MSELENRSEEMYDILFAVRKIVDLLVMGKFDAVAQACSKTRLTADDIRSVIDDYGRHLKPPPAGAYSKLDVIKITNATRPTWSVRVPLYTVEEGISDLTLELTVIEFGKSVQIELDDIHVL